MQSIRNSHFSLSTKCEMLNEKHLLFAKSSHLIMQRVFRDHHSFHANDVKLASNASGYLRHKFSINERCDLELKKYLSRTWRTDWNVFK